MCVWVAWLAFGRRNKMLQMNARSDFNKPKARKIVIMRVLFVCLSRMLRQDLPVVTNDGVFCLSATSPTLSLRRSGPSRNLPLSSAPAGKQLTTCLLPQPYRGLPA